MPTAQRYELDPLKQGYNDVTLLAKLNKLHTLLDGLIVEQATYIQAESYPEDFYIKIDNLFSSIDAEIVSNKRVNRFQVLRCNDPRYQKLLERQAQEQIPALEKILVLMREIQQGLQPAIENAAQKEGEISMKDAIQQTIEYVEGYLQEDRENCEKCQPGGEYFEAEKADREEQLKRTGEIAERRRSIFRRAEKK